MENRFLLLDTNGLKFRRINYEEIQKGINNLSVSAYN